MLALQLKPALIATILFFCTSLAHPKPASADITAEEAALHRFVARDLVDANGTTTSTWVPSPEVLNEQEEYYKYLYILDPVTNKTVLNTTTTGPAAPQNRKDKRVPFNFPPGAECRPLMRNVWQIQFCPGPNGRFEDCSFNFNEFRIANHHNPGQTFAGPWEDVERLKWVHYGLDNHRPYVMSVNYQTYSYGIESAWGYIDGVESPRNMKGSNWCWTNSKREWWGYWTEAACSSWCDYFEWSP